MRATVDGGVPRPRDEVFDFVADPANLPLWTAVREVARPDREPVGDGTRFATYGGYGRRWPSQGYTVTTFERPTRFAYAGDRRLRVGSVTASVHITIEADGGGSRVRYAVELRPASFALRLVDVALGWSVARAWRRRQAADIQRLSALLATESARIEDSAAPA